MPRHASVPLQRQPLRLNSPWLELLGALPLSPYSFISGSAATWIALHTLGKPQSWVPGDIDVFCLGDREQFCLLASNFIRDMKSASAPKGLSMDELIGIGRETFDGTDVRNAVIDCYINCTLPSHPHVRQLTVSFIHIQSMEPYRSGGCVSIQSVLEKFDIDICRVAICSTSEWMCSEYVLMQLEAMQMSFVLSVRNGEHIGYNPFGQHERVLKYMQRGFRIRSFYVNIRSCDSACTEIRVRFFNNVMMVFQHFLSSSFHPLDASKFCSPDLKFVKSALYRFPIEFHLNDEWNEMMGNVPLNADIFIAGEAALWMSNPTMRNGWVPDCVKIICISERAIFLKTVKDFANSSSCFDFSDNVDIAGNEDKLIVVKSKVGRIIFHQVPSGARPRERILHSFDISLCRVIIDSQNHFFCSNATKADMDAASFSFELLAKTRASNTVNRVHKWLSRGFNLKCMHMRVDGITAVAPHERISMFHNAMLLCMSLVGNRHPQLVGHGGIQTLYPKTNPFTL